MAIQIIFNVFIAFLWTALVNHLTAPNFIFGYILGALILYILRRFFEFNLYFSKVWAFIKLAALFAVELFKANIDVMKIVLSPDLKNEPGIVAVETRLKTDIEVTLLAALISLTPGTVSMDFSEDGKTIYIHALDVGDKDEFIDSIRNSFERAIMEVTQ